MSLKKTEYRITGRVEVPNLRMEEWLKETEKKSELELNKD